MATEAEQRAAVVAEALSWQGTKYHHMARLKGVGVDCAGLPMEVYEAAGVTKHVDPGPYSPDWYMHQDEERYLGWVRKYAREITREELKAGDFVIWKFGRCFSHGAVVIDPPTIIHAVRLSRSVHLANMDQDDDLPGREVKYFTFWGG